MHFKINNLIRVNQGGLRNGYKTTDHIFILKTLINKYIYNCKKKLFVCCDDLRKVFGNVWKPALFLKLKAKGIIRLLDCVLIETAVCAVCGGLSHLRKYDFLNIQRCAKNIQSL